MIAELKPGQKIADFFVVRNKEIRTKKDSKTTYLSLELGDASGRIFGSLWEDIKESDPILSPGKIVKVRATVIDWHGSPHLSIEKIRSVVENDQVSLESFLPCSLKSSAQLLADYHSLIKKVKSPHLKQLLLFVANDPQLVAALQKAPGGKLWHHCYLGGLLEHSIHVANLVLSIAKYYDHINSDLLLAGALLHDIGKIAEYKWDGFIDFSDVGRLHGHIAIGYHLLARIMENMQEFPTNLRNELLHLVLSHQGKKEHGSPVEPMTREALILNYADEIDSNLGAFERIFAKEHEQGKTWSCYVNLLDRFLYFGENTTP